MGSNAGPGGKVGGGPRAHGGIQGSVLPYGSKECGLGQGIILTSSQQVPSRAGRAGEGSGEKLEGGRGKDRGGEGCTGRVLRHQWASSHEQEGGGVLGAEVLVVFLGGRCPPLGDSIKGKEPQKAGKVGRLGLGPG